MYKIGELHVDSETVSFLGQNLKWSNSVRHISTSLYTASLILVKAQLMGSSKFTLNSLRNEAMLEPKKVLEENRARWYRVEINSLVQEDMEEKKLQKTKLKLYR